MNEEISTFISSERQKGTTDEAIRQSLISKGWDPIVVHRALMGDMYKSASNTLTNAAKSSPHATASQILLFIGIACILVAAVVFISLGWPDLSTTMRFMVLLIPNLLLFAIGGIFAKGNDLEHVKEGTLASGLLMLPITIGVGIFQFGFYGNVDVLLMAVSVMLSLPFFIWFFISNTKFSSGTFLIAVNLIVTLIFLSGVSNVDHWVVSALTLVLAFIGLTIAIADKTRSDQKYLSIIESATSILFIFSVPTLVADLATKLFAGNADVISLCVSILGGGLLIAMGVIYGKIIIPTTKTEACQQRFLLAAGALITFGTLLGAVNMPNSFALISVALAAIIMVIGSIGGVRILTILGLVGGIFNLLNLLFGSIESINVLLMLFVLGFVAIAGSILVTKLKNRTLISLYKPDTAKRMGLISDEQMTSLQLENNGNSPTGSSILFKILIVIAAFWALELLSSIIFRGFF